MPFHRDWLKLPKQRDEFSVDDLNRYLTVPQVAKKLGITEEWVRDLIRMKQIKAVKIGQWKIKPADLKKFIQSRMNVK